MHWVRGEICLHATNTPFLNVEQVNLARATEQTEAFEALKKEVRELKLEQNRSRHGSRASLRRDQLASAIQGHIIKGLLPNDGSSGSAHSIGAVTLDELRNERESVGCDSKHLFDNSSIIGACDRSSDNRAAPFTASTESDIGSDGENSEKSKGEAEEMEYDQVDPGVARKAANRVSAMSTANSSTSSRTYGLTIDTNPIGAHAISHRPSPLLSIAVESGSSEEVDPTPYRQQHGLFGKGQFDEKFSRGDPAAGVRGRHLRLLTRGGFFIKHSRFGKPHMRFVWMSSDLKTILWR